MARYEFRMQRLFVNFPLIDGGDVTLDKAQSNYVLNVLRMREGDEILLFNGEHGEWRAKVSAAQKKACVLALVEQTRPQPEAYDLHYFFAPLKQARLDYMVQKAVEMGAGVLAPVLTQHTQVTRLNEDRMRANALEAAEQCGILSIPPVHSPEKISTLLARFENDFPGRQLIFCDEGDGENDPAALLKSISNDHKLAILIGPEGGFSEAERAELRSYDFVTAIPLGPRILRADTAAVAALALVQSVLGDWR